MKTVDIRSFDIKTVPAAVREEEKSRKRMLYGFYYPFRSSRTLRGKINRSISVESWGCPVKKAGVIAYFDDSVYYVVASAACCARLAGVHDICVAVEGAEDQDISRLLYICAICRVKTLILTTVDKAFGDFSEEQRMCCFPESYTDMIFANRLPYFYAHRICIIAGAKGDIPDLSGYSHITSDVFADEKHCKPGQKTYSSPKELAEILEDSNYDAAILAAENSGIIERAVRGTVPVILEPRGDFSKLYSLGLPLIIKDPQKGLRLLLPDDFCTRPVYVRWK